MGQIFFDKTPQQQNTGCEPCLGDVGCLEASENMQDDSSLPQQLVNQLKIEESELTVSPKELEKMILELAVNCKPEEMKMKVLNYKTP